MDTFQAITIFFQFCWQHKDEIAIIVVAVPTLMNELKKRALKEFALTAAEVVRRVAVQELSGTEKRKTVVDEAYAALPLWAKKVITQQEAEVKAEEVYQLLKGELFAPIPTATTVTVQQPTPAAVDPTAPIVDQQNLEVKSPLADSK